MANTHKAAPSRAPRVAVLPGSARAASINAALGAAIAGALRSEGMDADLIDLGAYAMPLYDGDLEARDGVPQAATALADRLAGADTLVIVSPEYNGAFTPLLKNTVDWLTRVDKGVLRHLDIALAAASPGRGGGARALGLVRTWMSSMRLHVLPDHLSVPGARLTEDGQVDGLDDDALGYFVAQVISATSRVIAPTPAGVGR